MPRKFKKVLLQAERTSFCSSTTHPNGCHGLREHAASESNGCSGNRVAAWNRNITQPKTLLGMID
jgi:hypothetical protein